MKLKRSLYNKIKKILPLIIPSFSLVSLAGCTVQINPKPEPEPEPEKDISLEKNYLVRSGTDWKANVLSNDKQITFKKEQNYTFHIDLSKYDFESGDIETPEPVGMFWLGTPNSIFPTLEFNITSASATIDDDTLTSVSIGEISDNDKVFAIHDVYDIGYENTIVYHYDNLQPTSVITINLTIDTIQNAQPCFIPDAFVD